jgi:hypothetical protein
LLLNIPDGRFGHEKDLWVLLTYILIGGYLLLALGEPFYWQVGQREVLVNHPSNPYQSCNGAVSTGEGYSMVVEKS